MSKCKREHTNPRCTASEWKVKRDRHAELTEHEKPKASGWYQTDRAGDWYVGGVSS